MSELIELSPAERIDALVAVEAELCRLQAEKLRLVAEIAADAGLRYPDEVQRSWEREELALALRISAYAADDLLCFARAAARLPDAVSMLEKGQISLAHVRVLAEGCLGLDDEAAARVEARVLVGAQEQSQATFRRRVAKAVMAIAPVRAEQEHERAMQDRRVEYRPVNAGMAEIWALLPAPGALTVMAALNALTGCPDTDLDPKTGQDPDSEPSGCERDPRSAHQRRADALIHLANCALTGTTPNPATNNTTPGTATGTTPGIATGATAGGARPHIQVTIAASTLAGLDDHPADLDRHGPIPASLARTIAADPTGRWRRLLLDDTGQLLDYGRRTYRPPAALADHVIARDRVCQRPNCNRAATGCELDHVTDWNDDGETNEANLHALCPRDHHVKHDAPGWAVTRDGNTTTWTTPTGHQYTSQPQPYDIPDPPAERALRIDREPPSDPDPPPF